MKKTCLTLSIVALILLFFSSIAYAATSSSEAFSRMLTLKKQGKIPEYVLEKGYKYLEGIRVAYVKGKNVFMRSQPVRNARIITKLTHVDLEYLGEWKNPKSGERWVCVKRNDEIVWIYGQYIDCVKENNSTQTNQTQISTSSKVDDTRKSQSSNKSDSDKEQSYSINWSYVFRGVVILSLIYVVLTLLAREKISIEGFLKFFFWIAVIAVICFIGYFILKYIWEEIILPILSGIFLLLLLFGSGTVSSPDGKTSSGLCPYYDRSSCEGCPELDRYDHKYIDFYTDIHRCKAMGCYVDPKKSPYEQKDRLM